MRFRLSFLALVAISLFYYLGAVGTPAYAQQSYAPCSDSTGSVQQLTDQIKALKGGPDVRSFNCAFISEAAPGILTYFFQNDSTRQRASVIFEIGKGNKAVLLGAIYDNGTYPAKGSSFGWLNDAFLATGHGDPSGTWTLVLGDDPDEVVRKTIAEAQKAFPKRAP